MVIVIYYSHHDNQVTDAQRIKFNTPFHITTYIVLYCIVLYVHFGSTVHIKVYKI